MIDTCFTARVFDLITRIGANPGKNDKQSILKAHGFDGDELDAFKNILLLCYSPRYRFGMSYVSPPVNVGVETDIAPFFALAEDLNSRNVTGDAAVNAVKAMLENVTADTGELIRRVIHKDMRAGFGASTINKVFPKLVPEHAYMRCLSGDWTVECSDGVGRKISDIVESGYDGGVISWDFSKNEQVVAKIIGHFDNGLTDDWIVIEYEEDGVIKKTKPLTREHVLFLCDGREVQAGSLQVGDFLF